LGVLLGSGSITLERNVDGPSFGLGDARTRIFFEPSLLTITQMSYDGLAFSPEPDDCEFTEGEQNEDLTAASWVSTRLTRSRIRFR
jgi:hypothetical protein